MEHKNRRIINNIIYSFKAVWRIDKFVVFLYGLNVLLEKVQPFLYIFLPKVLLEELMSDNADWNKITGIILVFLLGITAANFIQRATYSQTSVRLIKYKLEKRKELALKIIGIEYAHMENPNILNAYNLAQNAVGNYCNGMEGIMREIFSFIFNVLTVIGYVSILATLNVFIVLALIIITAVNYFIKKHIAVIDESKREELEHYERQSSYYSNVMFDFAYGKEIRIFGIKKFLTGKYNFFNETILNIKKKVMVKKGKWLLLLNIINLTKGVICYGYLLLTTVNGNINIGSFLMYLGALNGFTGWIEEITQSLAELQRINIQVNDYRNFMTIPNSYSSDKIDADKELQEINTVEFRNVWFKYPGSEEYTLKNINLFLNNGDKLAVVGKNGGGKTTLVKLLCGFYEPTKGDIFYNGINLRDMNRPEYVNQLSVIFQTINIFAFSLKINVALCSKNNIDIKRVSNSLKSAGIDYIISKNKNGLDMSLLKVLDDEGIELSGGENQKIALSRAIYKDGSLMILDEPTSHLDALNEKRIYEDYQRITDNKISVFISHRLASAKFCDNIILIDGGEIAETGSHEYLIEQDGKYAEMFRIQSIYYENQIEGTNI